jgi:hypothetical protein
LNCTSGLAMNNVTEALSGSHAPLIVKFKDVYTISRNQSDLECSAEVTLDNGVSGKYYYRLRQLGARNTDFSFSGRMAG